ncbi:alpha/beta fold hydrolase [Nocardia asiatica]|uniref:alpha/beta fold hydrolase n=1 Tax=Nocardia asiatica TaxID=209252 RepID=UPI003EE052B4
MVPQHSGRSSVLRLGQIPHRWLDSDSHGGASPRSRAHPGYHAPSTIDSARPPASRRPSKQTEFSAREIEVLALAAQGLSNREIGAHLVIAPHTVESHLTRAGRKLGTSGRMPTVAAAQERGILDTGQPASDQPVATRSSDTVPAEHKAAADAPSPTAVWSEISRPDKDLPGHQDRGEAIQPRRRDHQPGSSSNSPTTPSRGHGISDLEVQILELTAKGLSGREIAEAAGVTQAKVKHSFEHLRVALGLRGDRAEIVTVAKQRGIIGDPRPESRAPTTDVEPENAAKPRDGSRPRRATRHTGLIGHASVPPWDDIGGADAFSDGAPSNLGKPRQMRKRLRELSELHIDGGGWVPGRPFRLDPDEAAVAAVRDLPADRGYLNPDLTLEFLPFYEFDGLRTQEDLEAVATAVGDMMRERGWRDRSQTEAATELVRAAGRNAMTYMERYTRSLQRSGVEWWDEQTAVQNMKARLTLRMATQGESRSLYVSLDVDQHRPERFPDITMFRWHAPLFSDVQVGTEVRELLGKATVSGVEQWGEVWARFDEPRPEPSGESVIEPPPRGDLEAKARIVRKLYDDHHIRFLGWEDPVVGVQAVESVDRALRNLIAEYGSRFALREFMFDDETVGFGVTRSFGSTTPDSKDYYSSIRLNRKIFTDPDFAQSWADQVADHRWAESDEDMIYELTHHEFIHVVADEGNWVLHDLAPALLRAAYELYREHELIPADVGYTEWLALLPHYSLLPFSHPVTDTFDPIEGVAEGARTGAVVSSLPLTHPARVLHWLTVTRDGSSPAEFLARWAQRQDSGDPDISLLLQDFRDVTGRDIAIPTRLRPEDTPIEILLAATGGQPQHFADAGEIAARLRTWDQSSGSPGNGVSALVVSAGEAPYLLVRRVSPDGHTRVEVRNPIEGVLRAVHVPSTDSPRPPGVQGIFFDETGAAITVPLAEAAGHDRAAPPTPAAESRHVNPQIDPAVAAGLAPERFRHPASRRKFGIISPDAHLAFHRNPENGRSWDENEPRPQDRRTSDHAETARPADDNPADTVTPGTTASTLEPSPSIRPALETAESEADEILAEVLDHAAPALDLVSLTSTQLIELLRGGQVTSVELTQLCLQRIEALSALNAVIGINPQALAEAARADELRRTGAAHGPLLGVPVLIKGNIDIAGMPTTAGSVALTDSYPVADATLVTRLRAAGAVILGHGNLTEFAFYLGTLPPGYSSYGGPTRNPIDSSLVPGGSSSGSAVAVAAGLVPLAIGTQTTGSVVGPANWNSIVGLKPTVGAVSRTGVVPIATTRDTPGALSPDVTGAAMLLTALVGIDPQDPATARNPLTGHDFTADLNPEALRGARIGVMTFGIPSEDSAQRPLWEAALDTLRAQGATLITVDLDTSHSFQDNDPPWSSVFSYEFKRDLNAYLSRLPPDAPMKNLADIIAYNNAHADEALKYGQDRALAAQAMDLGANSIDTANYQADLRLDIAESKTRIDAVMAEHNLTALVSVYDYGTIMGDKAGYPAILVPAGRTPANPDHPAGEHVNVSFRAAAWSEPTLIGYAYAFEQAHAVQRPRPQFADQLHRQATAENTETAVATETVTASDDRRSATVDGEADAGQGPAATDGTAAAIRRPAATRRIGLIGGVPDLIDPFDDRGAPWDRGGPVPRHRRINRLVEPHADGGGFARGRKQEDPAPPAVSEARGTVPNEAADNGVDDPVAQRISDLEARFVELNRMTVQRHIEGEAISADRLNRAYDQIEAELARLRSTGAVSDDVPVAVGSDRRLALDSVFEPERAYQQAYRHAMGALLGYPAVRANLAPSETRDPLAEIRRAIDRVTELAADTGRGAEIEEIEVLATIFEWTEQAEAGARPIAVENDQAGRQDRAVPSMTATGRTSDSADTAGAAPGNAPAAPVQQDRQTESIDIRRERGSRSGHHAALPDGAVHAVPEPDETADLGMFSKLFAALMPDGRTVHFRLLGDPHGYPILLSPGTPVGVDGPLPDPRALYNRGFALVVVERPGYGDSDPLPGRTVADCARDIIYIATELFAFDHYSVLGRSGGGSVAIAVGALDPDHVDRVVSLVGTAPRLDDMGEWMAGMADANQRIYARPDLESMAATLTEMAENIARDGEWLLRYNQDAFTRVDHMWVGTHRKEVARGYQRALRNYPQAWADDAIQLTGNWGIRFDQYRVPVDIVHGAADQFSPVDHSRNNARLIPTSKLYIFRGVSHMMGMDALPVIASHFRAERDAFYGARGDDHRIQAIQRAESDPLPFPRWMYWSRGGWDSRPDYADDSTVLDLPPHRARGLDGLALDPPPAVADPFGGLPRGVPPGAVAHAADPNRREGGAFARTAHAPASSARARNGDHPTPLEDANPTIPATGSEYWAEVDAAIEQVVAINPAFEYLRKMPKPAEGAPFGAEWVSNRREWFHALFHEDTETLRNVELTEKDLLELARLIKRAPLYVTLMLVNVTGSSIDQLVHDHKVDWRNLFFTQEKITRDGETIPVWKIRTLQVDTPEKASDRNVINEITPWARLQRTTSMDELPQLALIAAGVMQYFSGRPMLNPDIELMDDARRRGVITEEQYAFWIAYPKDDLWSAAFFPGCRWLEAQGDDYLKARVLCAFIWSRMGSRAAEEYLMEVIDRYLFSTVLREGAEFVLGTGTEIVESITGLLPGQAGQKLLETGQQVFGGVTGRIANTIRGLAGRAADLVYPAPEDGTGTPSNDNPTSEGQKTERDTETRTPDVGINRDAADGEIDLDEPLYVAHVPDDLDGPLYVVAPEEEKEMRGADEPIYVVSLDAIPSAYPPVRDLLPVEEYRHLGGDQGVMLPRATAVALRDAAVEHGERMSGSYNNIYLLGDFAIRVRKQGPEQLDFVLWPKEYQTLHALAQAGVHGVPQVLHVELDDQGDVLFQIQRRIYGAPVSNLHSPQVSAALVAMSRQLDQVPVPQELLPLPAWYPESGDSAGFFRMLMEHTEQIYQRYRSVERYRTIFARLGLGESLSTVLEPELQHVRPQRFLVIHGDLTSANVLKVSSGHAIVDFELALYGPKDYEAAVLTHRSPGSTRSLDPYPVHLEPWLHLLDMHRVIVDTVRLVEAANSPDPGHFRLFELSWNVTKSLARASQHSPDREVLSVDEILRLVVALRSEAAIDREEDLYVVATPDEPPPPDTSDARSSD